MPSAAATCEKGYCVKCKKEKKMIGCKKSKTKNNRNMLKGKCEECGTTMCKFVK